MTGWICCLSDSGAVPYDISFSGWTTLASLPLCPPPWKMAEVGRRLLWVPGSWGRTIFREEAVLFKKVSPGHKGSLLWQGDPSLKLKEDGVGYEGKKEKQKEGLAGQGHNSMRQKPGQERYGVGQTRSSLSPAVRSCQESRAMCEWDQRQRTEKKELIGKQHQEWSASSKSLVLKECLQESVLNRWVGLKEEVRSIPGPWIPKHLHFYSCHIPDNISFFLSSWLNPAQARGNDVLRDLTQIVLGHQTPHGTLNDTLRKVNLLPLLGQQPFRNLTAALICGANQHKHFTRAYATRNGTRRNNDSLKTPLFHSRSAYYDILGIAGTATQAQIKTAYYRQSFRYHPDRNSGNEDAADRFSEISEAYLILGSVTLRKKYDRGILSQEDVRAAGKPTSKMEGFGAAAPKRTQTRSSSSRYSPGKPVFDFDEFYRAHYGEQLERERFIKWKREQLRLRREDMNEKWQLNKLSEIVAFVFLTSAFFLLWSLK